MTSRSLALLLVVAAAIVFVAPGTATSATTSGTVFVAPGGSDASCVRGMRARPCATFGRAYDLAHPGDLVSVLAGTYPAQRVGGWNDRKPAGARITIAAAGAVTVTGTLTVAASNVTVRGFTDTAATGIAVGDGGSCSAYPCALPTKNVTIDRFRVQTMTIVGDTILVEDGNVGPHDVCTQGGSEDGIVVGGLGSGPGPTWTPSNRVTVKNVTVHDIRNSGCSNHVDGIQLYSWHNFTLIDSRIYDTDSSLVLGYSFDEHNPAQTQGIVIENNYFGRVPHPGHGVTLGAASGSASYHCGTGREIVENNTFYGNVGADIACGTHPAAVFRNNIVLASYPCDGATMEWTWSYNVFASPGPGCARTAHARTCAPRFVDPSFAGGLATLSPADTCARDLVPSRPETYPAFDARGVRRPQGPAVDAGATEVRRR